MLIVADTHVHVYDTYDVAAALRNGLENLHRLTRAAVEQKRAGVGSPRDDAPGAGRHLPILFLTEAAGSDFFSNLRAGKLADRLPGWAVETAGDPGTLWVHSPPADDAPNGRLLVVAGRQLITRERLEVLALACELDPGPKLDLQGTIEAAREGGGIPVLSWAPGKWSFARGDVVGAAIEAADPVGLLIGDTTLRASAAEPPLMRRARRRGGKVVAGSDPLPIRGEERILGTYGSMWRGKVDMDRPLASLRAMLLDPDISIDEVGKRSSYLGVFSRLGRHMLASKLGRSHA